MTKNTKPEQILKTRRETYQLIFKYRNNKIILNFSSATTTTTKNPGNSGVTNFMP